MENDKYGRTILVTETPEKDTYTVVVETGEFSVSFPHGESLEQVYSTINAMAPENWEAPE